jgi:cysteinyl-tRNA synthetase
MAQVWMHNGFLQVEGQKMSKSLGNFVTIHDLLDTATFGGRAWPGEVLRLAMLRTHYRQPIDWTVKALEEAERTLDRWYAAAEGVDASEPARDFLDELSDDLNTPGAIAALHGLMGEVGTRGAGVASARLLGLLQEAPAAWAARREASADVDAAAVEALIADRLAARRDKRWADSDRIRDELAAMGVVLKDNKDGTTSWDVGRKGTA